MTRVPRDFWDHGPADASHAYQRQQQQVRDEVRREVAGERRASRQGEREPRANTDPRQVAGYDELVRKLDPAHQPDLPPGLVATVDYLLDLRADSRISFMAITTDSVVIANGAFVADVLEFDAALSSLAETTHLTPDERDTLAAIRALRVEDWRAAR